MTLTQTLFLVIIILMVIIVYLLMLLTKKGSKDQDQNKEGENQRASSLDLEDEVIRIDLGHDPKVEMLDAIIVHAYQRKRQLNSNSRDIFEEFDSKPYQSESTGEPLSTIGEDEINEDAQEDINRNNPNKLSDEEMNDLVNAPVELPDEEYEYDPKVKEMIDQSLGEDEENSDSDEFEKAQSWG